MLCNDALGLERCHCSLVATEYYHTSTRSVINLLAFHLETNGNTTCSRKRNRKRIKPKVAKEKRRKLAGRLMISKKISRSTKAALTSKTLRPLKKKKLKMSKYDGRKFLTVLQLLI